MTIEQKLEVVLRILEEKKALDIDVLDVREKTLMADYFVICSGTSNTQIKAIADGLVTDGKEVGLKKYHTEGYTQAKWVLVDFGDIVVHIFAPEERAFYDLEDLWRETAELLESPGEEDEQ